MQRGSIYPDFRRCGEGLWNLYLYIKQINNNTKWRGRYCLIVLKKKNTYITITHYVDVDGT